MTAQSSAPADYLPAANGDKLTSDIAEQVRIATWRKGASYSYPWLQRGYMMQLRKIEYAVLEEVRRRTGGSFLRPACTSFAATPPIWNFPEGFFDLIMLFQPICLTLENEARQAVAHQAFRVLAIGLLEESRHGVGFAGNRHYR